MGIKAHAEFPLTVAAAAHHADDANRPRRLHDDGRSPQQGHERTVHAAAFLRLIASWPTTATSSEHRAAIAWPGM